MIKEQNIQNTKKGFTLLELLVVIVIIGILAAIALPQYRLVVGKSKFATLKNMTKSLAQSVNRYYLVHDAYPESYNNLDLDFSVRRSSSGNEIFPTGNIDNCYYWKDSNQMAACYMYISENLIGYYVSYNGSRPMYCYAQGTNQNHITHKICQQDSGKNESQGSCKVGYCVYMY